MVVLAEVIEHLIQDFAVLGEARRVLVDNGIPVVTFPFYHDDAEYHVRIHSPRSIERLLQAAGFRIDQCIEKGGGFTVLERFRLYTYALHFLNFLSFRFRGRTFCASWNEALRWVDKRLGRRRGSLWHRWSRHYGSFIQCVKADPVDMIELNRREFRNFRAGTAGGHERVAG